MSEPQDSGPQTPQQVPRSPIMGLPFTTIFWRKLLVGLALAALFTWLALRNPAADNGDDPRLVHREFLSMGTLFSVMVYLDDAGDRARADSSLESVREQLDAYDQRWDAWGAGELGTVNKALAKGERAQIPADLRPLFDRSADISHRTQGDFDVRVGALVKLWGFDDEMNFRKQPPADADIDAARQLLQQAPAWHGGDDAYGPAAGVQFDFGAIAKGDATDKAIAQLQADGFSNAIVNAGGNLRAVGAHGDRPWRIGIRHPRPDEQHHLLGSLELTDNEAVVTSGDYERYFEYKGVRYHHLLNPHSGRPARGLQSVTVVAPDGALADAASTALFVAGPDGWRAAAAALGLDQIVVVLDNGQIQATPKLAARLTLAPGLELQQ